MHVRNVFIVSHACHCVTRAKEVTQHVIEPSRALATRVSRYGSSSLGKRSVPEGELTDFGAAFERRKKSAAEQGPHLLSVAAAASSGSLFKLKEEPDAHFPDGSTVPPIRTGKRKLSTLRDRAISQHKRTTLPHFKDSILEQLPSALLPGGPALSQEAVSEHFWKTVRNWGLHENPMQATDVLVESLDAAANASKLDQRTSEQIALRYLWAQQYRKAADVLFDNRAMSGEFLPFFVPAGKPFYRSIVYKYVALLQSLGETHLAAMHLLTLGEPAEAVKTYQEAKLDDDAICVAGVKFLKEDRRLQDAFAKRGNRRMDSSTESWEACVVDLLIGQDVEAALQVVHYAWMFRVSMSRFQVLSSNATLPNAANLLRRLFSTDALRNRIDKGKVLQALRKALLQAVGLSCAQETIREIQNVIGEISGARSVSGESLFIAVLEEVRDGHFEKWLEHLKADEGDVSDVSAAGLVCLMSFKRCYDLLSVSEKPSLEDIESECKQLASLVPSKARMHSCILSSPVVL